MWGWGDAESGSFLPLPCRGLALAACLGLVLWLVLDTSQRPEQLVSFAGICVFVSLLFACSKHHRAVSAELSGPAWASLPALLGLAAIPGSQDPSLVHSVASVPLSLQPSLPEIRMHT